MTDTCVIVGASHAAGQLVVSLRQSGWEGDITVIGDEAHVPYHHPPLSKDYLSDKKTADELLIRPKNAYTAANVTLKLNTRVISIDRDAKTLSTDTGETVSYDKLVLAIGARVRKLPIEGADLLGVFYLRDMADVMAIKTSVKSAKRAVIIGGGYIGLETAASLKKLGLDVTVLEAMPRILQRVTAPELSEFYKRVHIEEGVEVLEGVMASSITSEDGAVIVHDKNDNSYPADLVIIGIGVIPNAELASDAGLDVGNGIIVNEFCQTSDPDIYAAGDVTWHYNVKYDRHLRLESVPNATEQAKIVAGHICGKDKAYDSLRGDNETGRSFAAFYFKGEALLAVDAVNAPREFAMTRMLLTQGKNLNKSKLADTSLALKELVV